MMINRKMMARKCGLSYDLLRYYEKSLVNILSLSKGSNNQILFDDKAQSIIMEAVALKKKNGYSMKQLFHHFNGTTRLDGIPVSDESSKPDIGNKNSTNTKEDYEDSAFRESASISTNVSACNSTDKTPDTTETSLPSDTSSALTVHQVNSLIGEQVVSAVSSEAFMNSLGTNIGNQVAIALSGHMSHYDNSLAILAQTMRQISEQSASVIQANSTLEQENKRLQSECELLSTRMTSIEESVKEQRESTAGKRFWRWFFGMKKDDDLENKTVAQREPQADTGSKVSESFGNYFRRFVKNPVPPDKNAAKTISSVAHFSRPVGS